MNDRDICVYLSPDNIRLLRQALTTAPGTGSPDPDTDPNADYRWLDGYLAEELATHVGYERLHSQGRQTAWDIPPAAYDTPGEVTPVTVAAAGRLGMPPVVLEHVQAVWCEEAARESRERRTGLCGSRTRTPGRGVVVCGDPTGDVLWSDAGAVDQDAGPDA